MGLAFDPQNEKNWKRRKRSKREKERERERERECLDLALGPVSDLFQTTAKGPSHIRKTLPRIRSTRASSCQSNLRRHVGATQMPLIADQRFRNSMPIHAWNCGAKCAELSCLLSTRLVEKEGEKDMNAPCLGRNS